MAVPPKPARASNPVAAPAVSRLTSASPDPRPKPRLTHASPPTPLPDWGCRVYYTLAVLSPFVSRQSLLTTAARKGTSSTNDCRAGGGGGRAADRRLPRRGISLSGAVAIAVLSPFVSGLCPLTTAATAKRFRETDSNAAPPSACFPRITPPAHQTARATIPAPPQTGRRSGFPAVWGCFPALPGSGKMHFR